MAATTHSEFSRTVLVDLPTAVAWCREQRLIPRHRVCSGPHGCGRDMRFRVSGRRVEFVCHYKQGGVVHKVTNSALEGTWFANSKFPIMAILEFTYFFGRNITTYSELMIQTSRPGSRTSSGTVAVWSSFAREVMLEWVITNQALEGQLGGQGVVVEIDEAKVGKRRNHRGRLVDGSWVLGIIEINMDGPRRGGRFRIIPCPGNRRDSDTLIPIIRDNVAAGTTICCLPSTRAYNLLGQGPNPAFNHFTVNHSVNVVDPLTGANTQTIGSSWRAMKAGLGSSFRREHLLYHLAEFLFRRDVRHSKGDPFMRFVEAIAAVYPGV